MINVNAIATPLQEGLQLDWAVSSTVGLGGFLIHTRPQGPPEVPWETLYVPANERRAIVQNLSPQKTQWQVRALSASGMAQGVSTPLEAPKSILHVGLNAGNWGPDARPDIEGTGIRCIRLAHGMLPEAAAYKAAGFHVTVIFGESGTLSAINPSAYAEEVVAAAIKYDLDCVELINEWCGNWFWKDAMNVTAYMQIISATVSKLESSKAKAKALIGWDGGKGGSIEGGEKLKAAGVLNIAKPGRCMVTVHPYGGDAGQYGGLALNRKSCEQAIASSGLSLAVTEAGLPTGTGPTGDSQAWTQAQQAEGLGSFARFLAALPKAEILHWYGYKNTSDSGPPQYGVEMHDSWVHKPAFHVLGEAAQKNGLIPAKELAPKYSLELEADHDHTWRPGEKPTPYEAALG